MGDVIIRNGKAYVPTNARLKSGLNITVEPVHTADLTVDELAQALERTLPVSDNVIADPAPEELKKLQDLLPKATRARSWKAMARDSLAYGIEWTDRGLWVSLPKLDKQGRFAADAPRLELPVDTSIRDLAAKILEDAQTRLR